MIFLPHTQPQRSGGVEFQTLSEAHDWLTMQLRAIEALQREALAAHLEHFGRAVVDAIGAVEPPQQLHPLT